MSITDTPVPALAKLREFGGKTLRIPDSGNLPDDEIEYGKKVSAPTHARPRTRGDCKDGPRPCPFVSCSHHLYLDVNPQGGSIEINFPHVDVWDMAETCSLDVAERSEPPTLEEVGKMMNLTRERIRQLEEHGLKHANKKLKAWEAGKNVTLRVVK